MHTHFLAILKNQDGMPARESLKGIHPAEQHSSILGILFGLKEALEALLADHHQTVALCKPD